MAENLKKLGSAELLEPVFSNSAHRKMHSCINQLSAVQQILVNLVSLLQSYTRTDGSDKFMAGYWHKLMHPTHWTVLRCGYDTLPAHIYIESILRCWESSPYIPGMQRILNLPPVKSQLCQVKSQSPSGNSCIVNTPIVSFPLCTVCDPDLQFSTRNNINLTIKSC